MFKNGKYTSLNGYVVFDDTYRRKYYIKNLMKANIILPQSISSRDIRIVCIMDFELMCIKNKEGVISDYF